MSDDFGVVCEHGHLKRCCPNCEVDELERENAELRKQLEQANEAVRALSEGKPLGPIAGVHTIYNQAVEIKRLKEQLEQAEARFKRPYGYVWYTKHMERRFTHRLPERDEMVGDAVPVYRATSPASPQTDSSHPETDQSNR